MHHHHTQYVLINIFMKKLINYGNMQCIHPRASSQFELTAAELREVDAAILVLWGVFWWVWSAMDGWMDGWHLSSLALTLHTAPEGDTGLIWDPSRNSNRICKFNVQASIEWVNEKNLPRDLHYWSLIFWLFLIKIWSKINIMVVFSLINLNGVKSDCYLKFWGNMLFILKSSFLV